jgi:phosphoribosylaminoimidazolecarboxamide formyltransferase/IMP cyclohydrolase
MKPNKLLDGGHRIALVCEAVMIRQRLLPLQYTNTHKNQQGRTKVGTGEHPAAGGGTAAMTLNIVERIDELVKVKHVLLSVSDKSGLDRLVPQLLDINPDIRFFSTGGTFARLSAILGDRAAGCLTQVSDYTGQPETQGGLVKTLDFRIYLGLLTETYNDDHQRDLTRTRSVPIDMVIVNLYPFAETIRQEGVTVEKARGNIDIGGPCMIRASAKNFIRVASVVDPSDYEGILSELRSTRGICRCRCAIGWPARLSTTRHPTTAPSPIFWLNNPLQTLRPATGKERTMAEDLKKMYRTIVNEHFPPRMEISFVDDDRRQTLCYEKVTWTIDGDQMGLRYGKTPGRRPLSIDW